MARPSNRMDIEANVVEDPVKRYCKLVAKIILCIVFCGFVIAMIGIYVAGTIVDTEVYKLYRTYCLHFLVVGVFLVFLCGILHQWRSDSITRARNELRRCCRNLRRTVLIRIPAFFTRYLRGHDPLRGVEISTIRGQSVSYNVAAAALTVQIESPEPQHQCSGSVLTTETTYEFTDPHPHVN